MTPLMLEATKQIYVKGPQQEISMEIDATKCSPVIDISTSFQKILGVSFPNHMLRAEKRTIDEIK